MYRTISIVTYLAKIVRGEWDHMDNVDMSEMHMHQGDLVTQTKAEKKKKNVSG